MQMTETNFKSETTLSKRQRTKVLNDQIRELKNLCQALDPFLPIEAGHQEILKKYQITEFDDPFKLTNRLILLLENAIEEKMKLEKEQTLDV